jgi:hypothetical protein
VVHPEPIGLRTVTDDSTENLSDHGLMPMSRVRAGLVVRVAGGALVALAVLSVPTLAAGPIKGASYHGALSGSQAKVTIAFKVSAAGEIQNMRIGSLPNYCGRAAPGTPKITFPNTKVSANGTFTIPGKDLIAAGPLKGSVVATLRVSGRFASGGKETGTVTTTYGGPAKKCGGQSAYATVH